MEFIGVRMSCDMEFRKSLLACEACSAALKASSSVLRDLISAVFVSVMS